MTASSPPKAPWASIPCSMAAMVSASTGLPPGAPQPGWRPNCTVGTRIGSIPSLDSARACMPPPTRLAATKLERMRTVGTRSAPSAIAVADPMGLDQEPVHRRGLGIGRVHRRLGLDRDGLAFRGSGAEGLDRAGGAVDPDP